MSSKKGSSKKREREEKPAKTAKAPEKKKSTGKKQAQGGIADIKRRKDGSLIFDDYPEFRPRLLPRQVLEKGGFGGTYFRPIKSGVTGKHYKDAADEFADQFEGIPQNKISSSKYDKKINRFGVKAGADLDQWEEKGWIKAQDPYGWFQWYCRFVTGRRTEDDGRQIQRWLNFTGPKGRWRRNLINKVNAAETTYDDASISPVIRQGLHHWADELRPEDL